VKRLAHLVLLVTAASACNKPATKPDFVVADDNHALAFFIDHSVADRHKVTPEEYEKAFRKFSEMAGEAIAEAVASMFFPDDQAERKPGNEPPDLGISGEAFVEIFNTTRVEKWAYNKDGTHVVLGVLTVKPMSLPGHKPGQQP